MKRRRAWIVAPMALALLAGVAAIPSTQQQEYSLQGDRVRVYNLAGTVEIVRGGGDAVRVLADVGGSEASELEFRMVEVDGEESLVVYYPEDEILYRRGDSNSRTRSTFSIRDDGTFGRNGNRRVTVRTDGSGMDAHADLRIEVPSGRMLSVYLGVGDVDGEDVDGDLEVDVSAGEVTLNGVGGSVDVDTGSGRVDVRSVDGSLNVDTGSGDVVASDIGDGVTIDTGSGSVQVSGVIGGVSVDTGSGRVQVIDLSGGELVVDTGSGAVEMEDVEVRSIDVDTGSGRVEGSGISARSVVIDLGSGGVDLGMMSDFDEIEIDTSSGGVTIRLPEGVGAILDLETRSGGIDVDIPAQVRESSRRRFRGQIGSGDGEINVDAGSGGIRIRRN